MYIEQELVRLKIIKMILNYVIFVKLIKILIDF